MIELIMDAPSTCQAGRTVNCIVRPSIHNGRMGGTPTATLPASMRPEVVAPRIVAAREALELKKSEMADALSVDRSAWTKYEKAERPFPPDIALRAAERYDLTMDYFFRGRLTGIEEPLRGKILDLLQAR